MTQQTPKNKVLQAEATAAEGAQVMGARIGVRLLLFIVTVATIGCDRVTKHVVATTLSGAPSRSFAADTFRLDNVENTGAFLSLGADWPPRIRTAVFGGGTAVLLVALTIVAIRNAGPDTRSSVWRCLWPAVRPTGSTGSVMAR